MFTFLKWLIMASALSVGGYIAIKENLINTLLSYDISYLSFVIIALVMVTTIFNGVLSLDTGFSKGEKSHVKAIQRKLQLSGFVSKHCFTLGMIGTIVGFLHLILGVSNSDDVQSIVVTLKTGLGTALFTTLTGLVAHIILAVQIFNIDYDLKK